MTLQTKNRSTRLPLAITLIVAAFVSAFLMATFSNQGSDYWVINSLISSGHHLESSDVSKVHMNLDTSSVFYSDGGTNPIGMVVTRNMYPGEILGTSDLTSSINAMSTSAVPISVRAVDIATGLGIGEQVDIYWVLDTQSGESAIDPILILGGVTVLSYDDGGKNFGSDTGLSVAVEETQVLRLLSATTVGRLVVIRSHV
jgi:hypothetical protein